MRMSCNGCRILRKGCTEDCVLRPCLEWIKSPEAQANATMFLAKFYGRAGLINLISAAPLHHRTAIFRSLLYEACGRIINPIYGAVGLLSSGSWEQCQSALNSVLDGSAIMQNDHHQSSIDGNYSSVVHGHPTSVLNGNGDIRHVNKSNVMHHDRRRKRSSSRPRTTTVEEVLELEPVAKFSISGWNWEGQEATDNNDQLMMNHKALFGWKTELPTFVNSRGEQEQLPGSNENCEAFLELTLASNHVVCTDPTPINLSNFNN